MAMTTHWERIDRPLLIAIYETETDLRDGGTHGAYIDGWEAGEKADLYGPDVLAAFENLTDEGMIEAENHDGDWLVRRVTPSGLRALGEWPSGDELSRVLPELLEQLSAEVADDEVSRALKRGADVLQGVATATIATVLRQVLGLG